MMNKRGMSGNTALALASVFGLIFIMGAIFIHVLEGNEKVSDIFKDKKTTPETKKDIVKDCENLLLFDTAECLVANVKTFYKFNITRDDVKVPFSYLLKNGGDCKDWSELYSDLAEELGYENKIIFFNSGSFGHDYFLIWNLKDIEEQRGYCAIDQLNYDCHEIRG